MSDLISKQAAICAIEEYVDRLQMVNWKENPGVPYKAHALNWAINTLRELPSTEPKQHGRWKPVTNGRGGFECSVCTNYAPSYQDGVEWLSRFCPNCGAKMDEVEE